MKIALVHDYIKEYGGAERVLETLHEMYPDAPIFTLVYCPEFLGPHRKRFENWDIRPSILQYIPFRHKLISPFRLLAPFVFPLFNFAGYEIVIVSATGAYSPNIIRTRIKDKGLGINAKHICYYHTPPRYLYGLATARDWKKNLILKFIARIVFSWLRKVDVNSSKNVDIAIANSQNVAERIRKFYHKEAVVIYPPVDIPTLSFLRKQESRSRVKPGMTGSYYVAGGRLARPKHIDLIIKACMEMGVQLKVFGKGFAGYGEELQKIVSNSNIKYPKSNIQLVGEVTDEEKTELMRGAKAYIFAAEDEDFGMLPIEAMAQGTPVIAYRSGGPKESIIDPSAGSANSRQASSGQVGQTGIFFEELSVKSIIEAVKKFQNTKIQSKDCIKQAEKFSKENFVKQVQQIISKIY